MRFASIVGARPQFIKMAPVSVLLRQHHEEIIIHTGQHYDYMLSTNFFKELSIPEPDYSLECGSGTHGVQTGKMLAAIEQVLIKEQVDWVIVYGDTNSTLAAALAAAKLHIPIAHIEAGLRSFDRAMPEEINRIVTDHISDRLFCPTESAHQQLLKEGITQGVSVVGDVMYDTLLSIQPRLVDHARSLLASLGLTPGNYMLTTIHRAANTDNAAAMQSIAAALNKVEMPVLFPAHPRTKACLQHYQIQLSSHVRLLEPVGYLDMLALQYAAYRILTDSGGIQKEAFLLGVPCITLREETEWIETVQSGWNILAGSHWQAILDAVAQPAPQPPQHNPFGQGDAAQRIVQSWL
ncbi:UDP-N-acetyl glucosamine 2-epimerase [Dictyobacter sp. S3.2.2.5]|uniref:UDP-N-acetyl glucosamine 2-epimerase n=1 Tax=Dictyobacter halimunensis TaxID=3026934 RepID=A0ABQ6FQU0_9CHLR|nr:UDP-N-acetyl glucosamine 2-epimerase [Dictyobacter sp. S3.2.2.5]